MLPLISSLHFTISAGRVLAKKKSSWTILVHKRIAKWLAINSRQVEKTPSIVRFMKPQKASLGNDTLQVLKKQTK